MDWICIIIGVIFLVYVITGWVQGMFKVLISTAGLIASILVATYIAPTVSGFLEENTEIDENIAVYIAEELDYAESGDDASRGVQVEIISALPVSATLKNNILDNNNSEMYSALNVEGIYDYIAKSIAVVILNATVFLVFIIVCRVFFVTLGKAMDGFKKLPIVRSVDKVGGGLLGSLKGLIFIWIVFLVLSITSTSAISQELIASVNNNGMLKLLYDNNLLLDIVGDLTKVLFF